MEQKYKITLESLDKFTYKGVELSEQQVFKMSTVIDFEDYSHLVDFLNTFKEYVNKLKSNGNP